MKQVQATILIAEDDFMLREALTSTLALDGYTVYSASSGQEAWLSFQKHSPTLVLADQNMPGLLGLGLLDKIRQSGSKAPFVLISGFDLDEQAALNAGASLVLRKPIDTDGLLDSISQLLRARAP